jgi:hypothetical protein
MNTQETTGWIQETTEWIQTYLERFCLWKLSVQYGLSRFNAPDDALLHTKSNVIQVFLVPNRRAG